MAARSSNGWTVVDKAHTRVVKIPGSGVALRVRDDPRVATILTCIAWWVDTHVEDIDTRQGVKGYDVPDDWGWAVRKIRGAKTAISNHASGTAIDLNAVAHPMAVRGTWSADERTKIHGLLDRIDGGSGVVRWGEDYRSRVDGMHFEINTTDRGAVTSAAGRALLILREGGKTPPPQQVVIHRTLKLRLPRQRGADVRAVRVALGMGAGHDVYDLAAAAKVRAVQRAHKLADDGIVGPKTCRALGWTWAPGK